MKRQAPGDIDLTTRTLVWAVLAALVCVSLPHSAATHLEGVARRLVTNVHAALATLAEKGANFALLPGASAQELRSQRDLLHEITTLRQRLRLMQPVRDENEHLKRLLRYRHHSEHDLILCRVVARNDLSGWWRTVRLDRGHADGVEADMAVVTAQGLVGKTRAVDAHGCDVLLITDPKCRVACTLPRSQGFGVVIGQGFATRPDMPIEMLCAPRPNRLEYVPKAIDIKPKDEVTSSGLGGVFPPGLLVGHVAEVELDASGLCHAATLVPAVDLQALHYVFIVCPRPSALATARNKPDGSRGAHSDTTDSRLL